MDRASQIYKSIVADAADAAPLRISSIQRAMLDASIDCIKMISPEGRLLHMNRAGCLALGVAEESDFGMLWLPLLDESVHRQGNEALQKASQGDNARFPGMSGSGGDIRYWDNLLSPVFSSDGDVHVILCVSRDVTEKHRLERQLEKSIERENLIAREMHHRVKNLYAVVAGLISISEREAAAGSPEQSATAILREKLGAMARASDALFAHSENESGTSGMLDIGALASAVLRPYGAACIISVQATAIRQKHETTLALFLHELATNSVKYGALGSPCGRVDVEIQETGGDVNIIWTEKGGPVVDRPPDRLGFGGKMLDRLAGDAGGSLAREWLPDGLVATLRLPLEPPEMI